MNDIFERFVSKWSTASVFEHRRGPEDPESLQETERALGITLPQAYVDFMLSIGAVWTPEILNCVVDQELEMPDIQNIESLEGAVRLTRSWQELNLPSNMFALATDCMGNMFCFDTNTCVPPRSQDLPVYFFDHDFATTKKVANSFVALLESYAALEK